MVLDNEIGNIIHFDNEHSWQHSNKLRKDSFSPFRTSLLGFSKAHRVLNQDERQYMIKELISYKYSLPRLESFLASQQVSENMQYSTTDVIFSLKERLVNLEAAIKKLHEQKIHTLADVILEAHEDYRKIIYLKLTILLLNRQDSLLPSDFQALKQEACGESGALGSYWEDLIDEFDDKHLKETILEKLENEWIKLPIDKFMQQCVKYLAQCQKEN